MRFAWISKFLIFLIGAVLAGCAFGQGVQAAVASGQTAEATLQSSGVDEVRGTYPQIVRVSLVEGDVRVWRGKENEKATGSDWERVAGYVPMASGYKLVTGKGRAEIEFEDASTVYLGEDSVLLFHDLSTKDGVPRTKMELLAGTVTLHLQPTAAGESYQLETAAKKVIVTYPSKVYARVNSYVDGMTIAPMEPEEIVNDHQAMGSGKSGITMVYGYEAAGGSASRTPDRYRDWDAWVKGRVDAREKTLKELTAEAGLSEAIPGLADLKAEGTFFACEPYGTCWQPKDGWGSPDEEGAGAVAASVEVGGSGVGAGQGTMQTGVIGQGVVVPGRRRSAGAVSLARDDLFPCPVGYDRYSGLNPTRYDWAVCHNGSWIYHRGRLAWVAGPHRHHHCPVRWVNVGGKVGYVPIHPRDVAGKPPVNLKQGIYVAGGGNEARAERLQVASDAHVKVLGEAPREFRRDPAPMLARAQAPTVEARMIRDGFLTTGKVQTAAARPVSAIQFDAKTHSFKLATTVVSGGKQNSFVERIGGNAGMPVRAGEAFSGGGRGGSGSGAGGSAGHSGAGSSASSGGGSHGGSGGGAASSGGGRSK